MATDNADVIVIGAGLAGLVAANELADAGRRVLILDQEGENSLGGQAFWSLGGLFMVDTPEQRRLGVKDSHALAWSDWLGAAQFDRPEDDWPRKTAEAYVDFASGEMRPWLKSLGMSWLPMVGWAERGGGHAHGHGNSVPRFHITWGAGPGVVEPFEKRVRAHAEAGRIEFAFRSRVVDLVMENGVVVGCRGETLAPDTVARGEKSNRDVIGAFEYRAPATLISSGGIGGNFQLFREAWPEDQLGPAPANLISGVPDHVDGLMIDHAVAAGARASIQHLKQSHEERDAQRDRVAKVRQKLAAIGIPTMENPSHIVPVMVGDPVKCKWISDWLMANHGIYVQPINYPTVPKGTERLRITPSPVHSDADIDHLVSALSEIWSQCALARAVA